MNTLASCSGKKKATNTNICGTFELSSLFGYCPAISLAARSLLLDDLELAAFHRLHIMLHGGAPLACFKEGSRSIWSLTMLWQLVFQQTE